MPTFSFEGKSPRVHPDAWIAPTATLIGDVHVEAGASVWYGAVLRGDYAPIIVRVGANVQDGAVLHCPPTHETVVGAGATVAHLCVIHGATIGRNALVANGSTILDGAIVGDEALVAAHSLVASNFVVPEGMLAAGSPATVRRPVAGSPAEMWVQMNPPAYADLAERHRKGITQIG